MPPWHDSPMNWGMVPPPGRADQPCWPAAWPVPTPRSARSRPGWGVGSRPIPNPAPAAASVSVSVRSATFASTRPMCRRGEKPANNVCAVSTTVLPRRFGRVACRSCFVRPIGVPGLRFRPCLLRPWARRQARRNLSRWVDNGTKRSQRNYSNRHDAELAVRPGSPASHVSCKALGSATCPSRVVGTTVTEKRGEGRGNEKNLANPPIRLATTRTSCYTFKEIPKQAERIRTHSW
jgi:hypothetical protein